MSAILLVLLSGLTMFGVTSVAPNDPPEEEEAEPALDDAPTGEEGSNPLDEALSEAPAPQSVPEAPQVASDEDEEDGEDESADDTPAQPAAETVTGSELADRIDEGAGVDLIDGREGDDTISGGADADVIEGGAGDDILYGGVVGEPDDGASDTLSGGSGADQLNLENDDVATGGEGADTFIRLETLTTRALVTDFDAAEDVIVVQHESDTPPTLDAQRIASDGVILEFSDGSMIELEGLTEAIDETLISFVDIREA